MSTALAQLDLPELVEADALVASRRHLQSDSAVIALQRAYMITDRIDTLLSDEVLKRLAFIYQQRGDYISEQKVLLFYMVQIGGTVEAQVF